MVFQEVLRNPDITIEAKGLYAYIAGFSGAGALRLGGRAAVMARAGQSDEQHLQVFSGAYARVCADAGAGRPPDRHL